jgi:hypothetical protein
VSPPLRGTKQVSHERTKQQVRLSSGIWDVKAAPGPDGVRLSFHTGWGARVRVQFSKNAPRWDEHEGHWEYPVGLGSPWFARIERHIVGTVYEAVPMYGLEAGTRYHYLITVLGDDWSPTRQRTGTFTAAVASGHD